MKLSSEPKTKYTIVVIEEGINTHHELTPAEAERASSMVSFFPYSKPFDFLRIGRLKKLRFIGFANKDYVQISFKPADEIITSEDLYIAQQSTALSKAIRGLFASAMPGKKMIFFVIIGIVAVLVLLQITGQVNLLKLVGL